VRVWVLGCRGSTPAPGPATVRYGGHTSALAVAVDEGPPTLLLDAGTGLMNLRAVLGGDAFRGALLLSHLHWDHTHGLPFSPATDRDDAAVALLLPAQEAPADKALAWAMSPPHFPIGPDGLRGSWSFHDLDEGWFEAGGFEVLAREIPHKGGRTFGYRVVAPDGRSLAYLPDHQPSALGHGPDGFGPFHEAAHALVDGVHLLVHDSQYTAEEFPDLHHFGHSAIDYAVDLARVGEVGRLLAFHHAPTRTDDELDALTDRFAPAIFAREGDVLTL
jgi:phosphoribosyl 1,2-cyclic phosphodiesterase